MSTQRNVWESIKIEDAEDTEEGLSYDDYCANFKAAGRRRIDVSSEDEDEAPDSADTLSRDIASFRATVRSLTIGQTQNLSDNLTRAKNREPEELFELEERPSETRVDRAEIMANELRAMYLEQQTGRQAATQRPPLKHRSRPPLYRQ
ncbi:protein TE34 [Testudinid alphaherpesvirus 3]|uniref:Protein TE34 n=1 Tax=Testudinid alphaherpesvirus 3 TaxID=2560801 RepID=A0A0K1R166_9ALPH|nr:protein TE34 [Testudinid alphaherpesvirus 3]AIU39307.1 protein TE34 [Testudinid alphaherpesvirus 3]AIU39417.1 protein TE34 [Testudinid alphaherpesvirus 3]AKI81693.1 protein TE34 [Testudinid alphaherpesvirus 3]AKI81796.1 protein TE34 [Testudinid alphaherpesvirus 3]AKV40660.1 hypothetical protein [Testudinid alphaherpesvirus 3]